MQRATIFLAYFFILPIVIGTIGAVNCFSQSAGSSGPTDPIAIGSVEQYPFVHYTPKDGLISNSIRNIYQDSKGRLYFTSMNGLSVYDGARFSNYTLANGLDNDIVNCVIELGDDSIWIVTNNRKIQCLTKGKLKTMVFNELPPLINNLILDERGNLYAASEQGLYRLEKNKFERLPFIDVNDRDVNKFIGNILPFGKLLLVERDNSLLDRKERFVLYLYDPEQKKIIAQTQKEVIFQVANAPDGRIWVSTGENILSLDTTELKKGKIVLRELPARFDNIKNSGLGFISFDQYSNCWMTDKASVLKKISSDGNFTSFTKTSGLSTMDVGQIFLDKEGTTWIPSFKNGVDKLVHNNFSFIPEPFGLNSPPFISYTAHKDQMLLFSSTQEKAIFKGNNVVRSFDIKNANQLIQLIETPKGIFGVSDHAIYKLNRSGNILSPSAIFIDTVDNYMCSPIADKNGNLLLCGKNYLTAVVNGKTISRARINYFTSNSALDTAGNFWIVTRAGELVRFETNPGMPDRYLEQKISFSKELSGINPRAFTIDRNNLFLIGSRISGLYAFRLTNGALKLQFQITAAMGLSDNFISYLAVDGDNNIWACSPAGLDKINIKNGTPVIENITRQNNIYQSVDKVVIDKKNTAWALLSNGLIKITTGNKQPSGYVPSLIVSMIKAGKDTMKMEAGTKLSHKQNNLSFYFAATSFLDEKQVLYSYRLHGSTNTQWSEPSNNATFSFIDLRPGEYTLEIKANFPAGRYPEQITHYDFSILPPWWQTWWFRSVAGILIFGLLIIGIRFYYRRKLEKQLAALEKQQAIEKERTRIATDMHDDLGAGLSRIKFLSETIGLKKQQQEPIEEDVNKIRQYSHEMIDKMGEIVWALNEKNDSLSDLLSYTRAYAVEYLSLHGIRCFVEAPEPVYTGFVSGEFRRNVYLTVKEALHNIVKHSQATNVHIRIRINNNLDIEIRDNGIGFDKNNIRQFSNGLTNMRSRIHEIQGKFEIGNGAGTLVKINVPLTR